MTVDGNAHVERHVRRRRRGGRARGKCGEMWRGTAGGGGQRGREGGVRLVRELTGGCCIDRENERAKVSRGWLARRVALATLVVPHPSGVRPPVGRPENHPRTPTTILSISLFFTLFLSIYLSFLLFFIGLAIYMYRTTDRYAYVRDLFASLPRSSSICLPVARRCAPFLSEIIGTGPAS